MNRSRTVKPPKGGPRTAMTKDINLADIPKILHLLPPGEQELLLAELEKLEELKTKKEAQERFIKFVEQVWPTFIAGRHHAKMAEAFERVARGECKRLIICMAPRHSKSEMASYLLPAWFLGKYPHKKVIQCSHTAELAVGFGRKVRNLVDNDAYKRIFPELSLAPDSKAAGRWNTSKGGDYFAIGVGGAVTGKGADILIVDDPHSEQEAALAEVNPEIYDKTYEWYTSGPRQRLQPGGSIVVVMTRWSKRDLVGRILQDAANNDSLDEWEVIEFPAILPTGNPLWPQFWSLEELLKVKRDVPNSKWMAQYQQNPVSESAAIVKREWWQIWEEDEPPYCDFILQSWDTAFEKTQRSDYSACTTWGVFYRDGDDGLPQANVILLNAFRDRMEFPELKRRAIEEYKEWEPDSVIIEKKASGAPLIYEMRAMGIPVQDFTPTRGNDKISRLNAVSDLFASGRVWAPATRWAEEVIDEVGEFPAGSHDDYTDTVSMAMMRFRRGGYVSTALDEPDEVRYFKSSRNQGYY
jgi:predicted phage terminase large subunit-like protein